MIGKHHSERNCQCHIIAMWNSGIPITNVKGKNFLTVYKLERAFKGDLQKKKKGSILISWQQKSRFSNSN